MLSEPKHVWLIQKQKRDKIEGYDICVHEWTDDTYTVHAYNSEETIIDHEFTYDEYPTDYEIRLHVEEILEEKFENPGSMTHVMNGEY
jgi:hypothetical protein